MGRKQISQQIRGKILKKYNFTCVVCGEKCIDKLEIDHILPVSLGGDNSESNLQILCKKCNIIKSNVYHAEEYMIAKKDEPKGLYEAIFEEFGDKIINKFCGGKIRTISKDELLKKAD